MLEPWFNYEASLQILIFGLLLGAGLPALFALAVRLNAEGAGVGCHGGTVAKGNPALTALSWVIFALVLARWSSACCTSRATSSVITPACTSSAPSPSSIASRKSVSAGQPAGEADAL